MGTKIKDTVSLFKGYKITDTAILKYIGIETYYTLKNEAPYLYQNFIECERENRILPDNQEIPYIRPKQFQVDLMEFKLSGEEIKKQILACIYEENTGNIELEINDIIRNLKYSSELPNDELKQKEPESTIILILFLLIIVSILFFIFYIFGFIDKITEPWIYE